MIATCLVTGALLAAVIPEAVVSRLGIVENGGLSAERAELHPGETVVYAIDWKSATRPAEPRLGPAGKSDAGDESALAAEHQWVRLVPRDPRAGGADTLELLVVGLGKTNTPAARLQDAHGEVVAQIPPLEVEIVAAIAEEQADPAPMRDPSSLDLDMAGLLIALMAAVVAGAAMVSTVIFAVWRWRRRAARASVPAPAPPPVPADRRALDALDALLAAGWLERGALKPFAVELAEIGKGFIGDVADVPLLELTTEECVRALRASGLGGAHAPWLQSWLNDLDMIKFAEAKPPADALRDAATALRRVIETLGSTVTPGVNGAAPV